MKTISIEIHVKVPNDVDDHAIDKSLAEAVEQLGGEVIDSKEFKDISE